MLQELALAIPNSIAGGGLVPQVLNDNDAAAPSSFCTALAEALTQQLSLDGEPLKREDLARASRADIRSAVERMVNSSTFLDAALSGQLVEELLLHLAKTGDAALCRNAIAHGASVSCRTPDKEGLTPLMLAAKHGSVECVRVLLNCGAPPDEQSHHAGPNSPARQTALHFACATRHEEAAVELIDAGASLDIKDSRNRKPLEALLGETPSGDPPHGLRRGFFDQNRPERERMHARLDKFAHGRLPSSNVMTPSALYGPLFYSKRSWRKEAHARMPPAMREAVMLVLLHSHRAQPNEAGWLPPELWPCVFGFMHRDWIHEPAPAPEPAPEPQPHPKPPAVSPPGRATAACLVEMARSRRKIDDELRVLEESLRHIGLVTRGDASLEKEVEGAVKLIKEKQKRLQDTQRQMEASAAEFAHN